MAIDEKKVKQINKELSAGLTSKAIARLQGMIFANPDELAYRNMLGEIYYSVHWLEKAGQYWYLGPRDDERKTVAVSAFENHHGNSAFQSLSTLKFWGDVASLTKEVQAIYRNLEERSLVENGAVPKFDKKGRKADEEHQAGLTDRLIGAGCLAITIAVLLLSLLGLITLVRWMF